MEPLVSVVIPSFRGAPRLGALFNRLLPALERFSWEIVLVDDGSDDSTWEMMLELAKQKANVTCLRLKRNSGQQAATLAGCAAASGRWILTIDDDLEHDPADIPRLLARAEQGYDLVYAVPRLRMSGFLRSAGSLLFDVSFRLLIGKPRRIRLTSFRVLSASLVRRMLDDQASAVYVSALALRQRPRVSSITVTPGSRAVSRTSLARLVRTFTATVIAYSLLGRVTRRRPVRDFLQVAEILEPASAAEQRS